tara:strand:+ start:451 stop:825 length:375 start_codon:yes stop_codon:yes gene_type:complete
MKSDAASHVVNVPYAIDLELLNDLLVTAVEGGSDYWATFGYAERDADRNYASVRVSEVEASGDTRITATVTPESLMGGVRKLAHLAMTAPWAARRLADLTTEDWDAETADAVLQLAVLGDVVYG